MHAGEVLLHQLLAVVPVAQAEVLLQVDPERNNYGLVVNHFHFQCIITIMPSTTFTFIKSPVLCDYDGILYHFHFQCIIMIMPFTTSTFIKSPELRNHDGVFQVSLHPLQALDALVASVPEICNFFLGNVSYFGGF